MGEFYPSLPTTHLLNRLRLDRVADASSFGADAVMEIELTSDVTNHLGGLQGGIAATLVDLAAGEAVRKRAGSHATIATQDMMVRYVGVLRSERAVARARVRRAGRRSFVVDVEIAESGRLDQPGVLATTSFVVLERS